MTPDWPTCPKCGRRFQSSRGIKSHRGKVAACAISIAEMFWANVVRSGPNECWLWIGTNAGRGYGRLRWKQNRIATHVALELAGRPPRSGQMVCHTCDNPPCVNPAHLYAGSAGDNTRDMVTRGRVNRTEETRQRKSAALRLRWATCSSDQRQVWSAHIGAAKTPSIRCESFMSVAGQACFRIPNHGGPHRTKASMERRRA
jgi:hypothetical protein